MGISFTLGPWSFQRLSSMLFLYIDRETKRKNIKKNLLKDVQIKNEARTPEYALTFKLHSFSILRKKITHQFI